MVEVDFYGDQCWRWMLIDDDGEPVAYDPEAKAQLGVENVKTTAPSATIVDR